MDAEFQRVRSFAYLVSGATENVVLRPHLEADGLVACVFGEASVFH
jgi:hypothetical protein